MRDACSLVWSMLALLFRSRAPLQAEILILRHQLNTTASTEETGLQCHGSPDLCCLVSFGTRYPQRVDACEAGHRHPLASCRVQIVLALEVTTSFRPTDGCWRNTT